VSNGYRSGRSGEKPVGLKTSKAFDYKSKPEFRYWGAETSPTKRSGVGVQLNSVGKGKINLQRVADVLEDCGMDPVVELSRIMKANTLDDKTRAMICLELIQYQQPKLKAVEQTHKIELSQGQVDVRLKQLLFKAGIAGELIADTEPVLIGEERAGSALGSVGADEEAELAQDVPPVS
jgi:hypothetical protein